MLRSAFVMLSVFGCLAAACGSGGPPPDTQGSPPKLFIGEVEGTDAKVALVRDDTHFTAYVCGGATSLSSLTTWFQGAVGETNEAAVDDVTATSEDKELAATLTDDRVVGTLTVGGAAETHFSAARVDPSEPAGLFQTLSSGCRTGLIIPPSGEGAPQGVYCANGSTLEAPTLRIFEQVTPLARIRTGDNVVPARVLDSDGRILYLMKVGLLLDSN